MVLCGGGHEAPGRGTRELGERLFASPGPHEDTHGAQDAVALGKGPGRPARDHGPDLSRICPCAAPPSDTMDTHFLSPDGVHDESRADPKGIA